IRRQSAVARGRAETHGRSQANDGDGLRAARRGGRRMNKRWDEYFLGIALNCAGMSKDPSTRVGAVIANMDRQILSTGFNGLPRGLTDTRERLENRDIKLQLVVHAELNAILNGARFGTRLKGSTLYLTATDDTGLIWGGPPCTRCSVEIMQAGI